MSEYQEPVAWRATHPMGEPQLIGGAKRPSTLPGDWWHGWTLTPLYAAPPAQAAPGEPERWRAVEGGKDHPPDLATFRRAAEEDRCAYCGIVDPEVDGDGHCDKCGGWLPPTPALSSPAAAPAEER